VQGVTQETKAHTCSGKKDEANNFSLSTWSDAGTRDAMASRLTVATTLRACGHHHLMWVVGGGQWRVILSPLTRFFVHNPA
jgi:hypothetical protein